LITINLVPVDELENQLWWVADAAVVLIVACASFFASQWYLGKIQEQTDEITLRATGLEESTAALQAEITRYAGLQAKKDALNEKIISLQRITVTKISKFEPVIVLEHLQNLKPEGIWFSRLQIGMPAGTFKIFGQGFDNLLLAEFMTGIRSTETQEKDDSDLRTHIFFANLDLINSAVGTITSPFPDIGGFPTFELNGLIKEKDQGSIPANLESPTMVPPVAFSQSGDANRVRF
jgi:Tfp pilus assembly protein PilN